MIEFVSNNPNVIYSEKSKFEDGALVIHISKSLCDISLKKLVMLNNDIQLSYKIKDETVVEFPAIGDKIFPVIFTYW